MAVLQVLLLLLVPQGVRGGGEHLSCREQRSRGRGGDQLERHPRLVGGEQGGAHDQSNG